MFTLHGHTATKRAKLMTPKAKRFIKKAFETASEKGGTVHSTYVNRPQHTMFMVLEAKTFEQIDDFFDPLLEMGNGEITPVVIPKFAQ